MSTFLFYYYVNVNVVYVNLFLMGLTALLGWKM